MPGWEQGINIGLGALTWLSDLMNSQRSLENNLAMYRGGANLLTGANIPVGADFNRIVSGIQGSMPGNLYGRQMGGYQDTSRALYTAMRTNNENLLRETTDTDRLALQDRIALRDRLMSSYGATEADLIGRAEQRMTTGMGILEGMGEQERADIMQAYGEREAGINQEMASRGLGGTTIGSTLQQGNIRERTSDLGRFEERMRGQRFGAYSQLSGDVMNLRNQLGMNRENLYGSLSGNISDTRLGGYYNRLNTVGQNQANMYNLLQNRMAGGQALDLGLTGDILGFMTSPNVGYPNQALSSGVLQNLGMASVNPWQPPQPSGLSRMFGIGGGAGMGAAVGGILAAPTGGLSIGAGMGLGALAGGGWGAMNQQW